MTGYQKNSISIFLIHEGRLLLKCVGNQMVSPSIFVNGSFDPDTLRYVQEKMMTEYELVYSTVEEPKLRYITLRWAENELRQNYFYFAETKYEVEVPAVGNLKWVPFNELSNLQMPKTVQGILKHYLEVGRSNERVYCGVVKEKGVAVSELEEFK